jgi:hypothetical protein
VVVEMPYWAALDQLTFSILSCDGILPKRDWLCGWRKVGEILAERVPGAQVGDSFSQSIAWWLVSGILTKLGPLGTWSMPQLSSSCNAATSGRDYAATATSLQRLEFGMTICRSYDFSHTTLPQLMGQLQAKNCTLQFHLRVAAAAVYCRPPY